MATTRTPDVGASKHCRDTRLSTEEHSNDPTFRVGHYSFASAGAATRSSAGYAKYIGRVGALAVALGVGVAVATGHGIGVARAETGAEAADSSTSAPSGPPTGSTPEATGGDPTSEPTPPSGSDGSKADPTDSGPSVPEMNLNASGGEDNSINDDGQITDAANDDELEQRATSTAAPESTSSTEDIPDVTKTASMPETLPALQNSSESASTPTAPASAGSPSANPPPAHDSAGNLLESQNPPSSIGGPAQARLFVALDAEDSSPAGGQQVFTVTEAQQTAFTAQAEPVAPPTPVEQLLSIPGTIVSFATTLVAAVLSPFLAPGPAAPAQPPLLLFAVLDWIRREIQRSFFNRSPVAVDNAFTTSEDIGVSGNVLTNDSDADSDPLTATLVTGPTHGDIVLNPDGSFIYTPDPDFNGTDTFTYKVSDETGGWHLHGLFGFFKPDWGHSDTATVSVNVTAVNDAPVADDEAYTVAEDGTLTVLVDSGVLQGDTDVDSTNLTVSGNTSPAHGIVTVNTDGSFTYKPDENFVGTDSFEYTVSDGALPDTGTVTITVTAVPDAPVADDDTYETDEDTPLTVVPPGLLGGDTDGDDDPLAVIGNTDPAHGNLVLNTDGSFTYTPAANYNGPDSFTYTISDGTPGGTDTATVAITVKPVDDATVASADSATVAEDGSVEIDVMANDSDVDGALAVVSTTAPAHGTAVINPAGAITYSPAANYNGPDSFAYTVSDGLGGIGTATVSITVTAVDDATVASADSATVAEDGSVEIDVMANDSDVDGALAVVSTTAPAHGTAVINAAGAITYTPAANYNGPDSFAYTVSDGLGGIGTATVSITVTAVSDAPVGVGDSYTTAEDTPLTVAAPGVLSNDSDVDGNPLTAVLVSGPANADAFTLNSDGSFTYTPAEDYNGSDSFTYKVNDGTADSNAVTVNITITSVNDPPSPAEVSVAGNAVLLGTTVSGANLDSKFDVAVNTTTNRAYVLGYDPESAVATVTVIDTATRLVVGAPIVVATSDIANNIAVSADGSRVYVTVGGIADDIVVIDTTTNTVIQGNLGVGENPTGIVVSPTNRDVVYIANTGETRVFMVNAPGMFFVPVTVGSAPGPIAMSPNGTRVFVALLSNNTVSIINTATNTVVGSGIPVGASPRDILVSPDNSRVYVASDVGRSVTVINAAAGTVIGTITLDQAPESIAISADGSVLYIANTDDTFTRVDTTTFTAIGDPIELFSTDNGIIGDIATGPGGVVYVPTYEDTIPVGNQDEYGLSIVSFPTQPGEVSISGNAVVLGSTVSGANLDSKFDVAVNATTNRAYVLGYDPEGGVATVTVINTATKTVVGSPIVVANSDIANNIAVSADGTRVFVTVGGIADDIVVIDTTTNTVIQGNLGVGENPTGIVTSPTNRDVTYVANTGETRVFMVNTDLMTFVPIAVGSAPGPIAMSPNGSRVFVALLSNNTVSIIDTASNTVVGSGIPVGASPRDILVSPDNSRVYVASDVAGTVTVINAQTGNVIRTIALGTAPESIAISADGSVLYVANTDDTFSRIDTTTLTVIGSSFELFSTDNGIIGDIATGPGGVVYVPTYEDTIPVANQDEYGLSIVSFPPSSGVTSISGNAVVLGSTVSGASLDSKFDVAVNTATNRAYVLGYDPESAVATVTVIDTATRLVVGAPIVVATSDIANNIAVSADGSRVYVTVGGIADDIVVIDTTTNTVIQGNLGVGENPTGIVVSPTNRDVVYIANTGETRVFMVNAPGMFFVPVTVGSAPGPIAMSPNGTRVFVALLSNNTVSIINTATNTVVGSGIPVGASPRDILVSPDNSRVYVASDVGRSVTVINAAAGTVIGTITLDHAPESIAISADGSVLYIANTDDTFSQVDTATFTVIGDPIELFSTDNGIIGDIATGPGGAIYVPTYENPTPTQTDDLYGISMISIA